MSALHLEGYGIYVWPSYAATFLVLGWQALRAYWQYRQTLKKTWHEGS